MIAIEDILYYVDHLTEKYKFSLYNENLLENSVEKYNNRFFWINFVKTLLFVGISAGCIWGLVYYVLPIFDGKEIDSIDFLPQSYVVDQIVSNPVKTVPVIQNILPPFVEVPSVEVVQNIATIPVKIVETYLNTGVEIEDASDFVDLTALVVNESLRFRLDDIFMSVEYRNWFTSDVVGKRIILMDKLIVKNKNITAEQILSFERMNDSLWRIFVKKALEPSVARDLLNTNELCAFLEYHKLGRYNK